MTDRRTLLKAIASCLTLPLLGACREAQTRPETVGGSDSPAMADYLRKLAHHEMDKAGVVGLSIAVLDERDRCWADGFGYADLAARMPATADTRYRAGSISKLFTSVAAMQLAATGRLDIDAPLQRALPDFSIKTRTPHAGPVTPRTLMTHHSGLPEDRIDGMWCAAPRRFTSLVAEMRDEYLAAPPGLIHAYSNLGFSLLGAAVEQVARVPFEQYMHDHLLLPLGMKSAQFDILPSSETCAYDDRGRLGQEPALRDVPAGGLNTSVRELIQFARMVFAGGKLDGRRVLDPASLAEMMRPQNGECALDFDLQVGLGWHFDPDAVQGGGPVLYHNGGTIHHRSLLMLLPEHRLAVAVQSNSANAMPVVEKLAQEALGLLLATKTGVHQPAPVATKPADPRHPVAPIKDFPGYYDTLLGFATITGQEQLRIGVGGERLSVNLHGNGYLGLEYRLLGLIPWNIGPLGDYEFTLSDTSQRRLLIARKGIGFHLAGERLQPVPIPAVWHARLGSYRYVGDDEFVAKQLGITTLKIEQGFLLAESQVPGGISRIALQPAGDDQAIVRGLGRGRGGTLQVLHTDGRERLQYAGLPLERVAEERT